MVGLFFPLTPLTSWDGTNSSSKSSKCSPLFSYADSSWSLKIKIEESLYLFCSCSGTLEYWLTFKFYWLMFNSGGFKSLILVVFPSIKILTYLRSELNIASALFVTIEDVSSWSSMLVSLLIRMLFSRSSSTFIWLVIYISINTYLLINACWSAAFASYSAFYFFKVFFSFSNFSDLFLKNLSFSVLSATSLLSLSIVYFWVDFELM